MVQGAWPLTTILGTEGVFRSNNIFDCVFKYLGDPLAKTVLGHLELLEGLSRSLDKEYKNGVCKCWKHIAEHFDIERDDYQNFRCNQVHSPTEAMFDYLESSRPETTIGKVKEGLQSIGIQDVVDVLIEYQNCEYPINNNNLLQFVSHNVPYNVQMHKK